MMRLWDIGLSALGLLTLAPLLVFLYFVGLFDCRSPLFTQRRVGRNQAAFVLVKFRTMRLATESVATHLANESDITTWGAFLRRTKLDELPQLWNVLKGEMSLVGPRPCLSGQKKLIEERKKRGVFAVRPGITGLAQVRGVDMSEPVLLSTLDAEMVNQMNIGLYLKLLLLTAVGRGQGDPVIRPSKQKKG